MNPSKVSAVWIHLGPVQVMGVFVPPETDYQRVVCYLAGDLTVPCDAHYVL
jgi:hypothetical protein